MDENTAQPQTQVETPIESQVPQEPVVENPVVEPVEIEDQTPFYQTWSFWILTFLIVNLGVFMYIWALPTFLPPIVVQDQQLLNGFNVKKTVAPVNGFLVIATDNNGIPGFILTQSNLLIPDTYKDFYLGLNDEEELPATLIDSIKGGTVMYASFYKDVDKNGEFNNLVDNEVAKNILGIKYQTKFTIKSTP